MAAFVLSIVLGILAVQIAKSLLHKPVITKGNYQDYIASEATPVTVYGTSWCPYCKEVRTLLKKHNIAFQDLDIEQSEEALNQFSQLGGEGVPVIVFNDSMIQGFHKDLLLEKVSQLKATN